jgi:hypothetical protein
MTSLEHASTRTPTSSTAVSEGRLSLEKVKIPFAHHSDDHRPITDSEKLNVEPFRRSSLESGRSSLYPVTSYASQIGGEGGIEDDDGREETPGKDPNLVEWDGPDDPNNPYNW